MTDTEKINAIFEIHESYELAQKVMNIVFDMDKLREVCDKLKEVGFDGKEDFLKKYYQAERAVRGTLKQDYTPDCICELIERITPKSESVIDICAGVGSLTLKIAERQETKNIIFEELSRQAVAVLLLNLAFRNLSAIVKEKDVLTQETKNIYRVMAGDSYSSVTRLEAYEDKPCSLAVSNPPFSLSWVQAESERLKGYDLPPKSRADFVFVLDALDRLSEKGKVYLILPYGVLFRNGKEGDIRKKLIENNLVEAVIELPPLLFDVADIPTVILILNKSKKDNTVKIINAKKLFVKNGRRNNMTESQIQQIAEAYGTNREIAKLSRTVTLEEIRKNEYNLSVQRYVNAEDEEEPIDIGKLCEEVRQTKKAIRETTLELKKLTEELNAYSFSQKEAMRPLFELMEACCDD